MASGSVRKHSIFALLSLFLVGYKAQTEAVGDNLGQCPTFWTAWRNHCYRYFGEEVSWYDALNTCRLFSTEANLRGFADLVSIHSVDEQEFLYHYWRSLRHNDNRSNRPGMWIGLNDSEENGVHVWSDHSEVTYTNFDRDEVENLKSDLYFMWDWLDSTNQPRGKWHDILDTGNWYFPFMCKMPRPRFLTSLGSHE